MSRAWLACGVFLLLLSACLVSCRAPIPATEPESASKSEAAAEYIGSAACGRCHTDKHSDWSQSLHSRMIQKAETAAVLGDFTLNNTLEYEGWRFRMILDSGRPWVIEWDPRGREQRYAVDYTLGSKRIQHYLSTRPDGRIRVVFPTWDVRKQKWFHSAEIIPTGHHAEVSIQIWNQHCYNCHVSQEKQGYDIESDTYRTTFTETGINCEMCHGPGSRHRALMLSGQYGDDLKIVHPGKLPPREQILICVQCHAPRIMVQNGFHPGKNYYDYYMPSLMHFYIERWFDPPMWADGRMRRFATEGTALWQSRCFLEGAATCIGCHNPHLNTINRDPRFRDTDVLCTQCHAQFKDENVVAGHTHHPLESSGSHCIECHMPPITNMIKDQERDHTISIPVPENTALYGIPNACGICHTDRAAQWAAERMDRWYPNRPKPNLRRATAFTLARKRDPASVGPLVELLKDPKENSVIRGSAAGFLGEFQGDHVAMPLIQALTDSDVMVKAEAVRSLSEVRSPAAVEPLKKQLADPNRIVRLNAVFALLKMGILEADGLASADFAKAKTEYLDFLKSFPDVYGIRVDLGTYYAVHRDYAQALKEYQNALKLRDDHPLAYYFLGVTYAQLGQFEAALGSFDQTLKIDPGFRNTQELAAKVKSLVKNR
ncbi:MAG: HEAT repeat domain-containing protein [Acidobacteria bacterium]|nr:HEAT repeat domain-containing protein [Acidobacteriota bacterium]